MGIPSQKATPFHQSSPMLFFKLQQSIFQQNALHTTFSRSSFLRAEKNYVGLRGKKTENMGEGGCISLNLISKMELPSLFTLFVFVGGGPRQRKN